MEKGNRIEENWDNANAVVELCCYTAIELSCVEWI
jgi:hypothetical protein